MAEDSFYVISAADEKYIVDLKPLQLSDYEFRNMKLALESAVRMQLVLGSGVGDNPPPIQPSKPSEPFVREIPSDRVRNPLS